MPRPYTYTWTLTGTCSELNNFSDENLYGQLLRHVPHPEWWEHENKTLPQTGKLYPGLFKDLRPGPAIHADKYDTGRRAYKADHTESLSKYTFRLLQHCSRRTYGLELFFSLNKKSEHFFIFTKMRKNSY